MKLVSFILRDIPPDLWRKVKARAALEGTTLRALLLGFLEKYATGKERKA